MTIPKASMQQIAAKLFSLQRILNIKKNLKYSLKKNNMKKINFFLSTVFFMNFFIITLVKLLKENVLFTNIKLLNNKL